jgi:hypothetical protein
LTALIEDALRQALRRSEEAAQHKPTPLPTDDGRGLQPGVDLDDSAALADLMEAGEST